MPEHAPTALPVIVYSPAEAAQVLGVTRQTIYNLMGRNQLRSYKVGRCTRIPAADVHGLVGHGGADDAA